MAGRSHPLSQTQTPPFSTRVLPPDTSTLTATRDGLGKIFHFLKEDELAKIATVCHLWNDIISENYVVDYPSWLREYDRKTWETAIDVKRYDLDFKGAPRVNRRRVIKALEPLSKRVKDNKGVTGVVFPPRLTLNKILRIAEDFAKEKEQVPFICHLWKKIIDQIGDTPVDRVRVFFFTNDILIDANGISRNFSAVQATLKQETKVVIQKPGVRNFMAFLALHVMSSPELEYSNRFQGPYLPVVWHNEEWPPTVPYCMSFTEFSDRVADSYTSKEIIGGFKFGLFATDKWEFDHPLFNPEFDLSWRDEAGFGACVDYEDIRASVDIDVEETSRNGAGQ